MKSILKICLYAVALMLISKCVDPVYYIKINNQTTSDISVLPGCKPYAGNQYPDTTLPLEKPFYLMRISKNNSGALESNIPWNEKINLLPSDTLSIIYFVADSVDLVPWEKIRSKYMIFKREVYSSEDLESNNWTITVNN
ncbi:MAG: hypothetical protein NTY95_18650 [Bacteroidia bacterium]|jgi:hypothetical protein|nr:hypothetical protein [Bacteroidia bacterium]